MLSRAAAQPRLRAIFEKIYPGNLVEDDKDADYYLDLFSELLPDYNLPEPVRQVLRPLNPEEIPTQDPAASVTIPAELVIEESAQEAEITKKVALLRPRLRKILAVEDSQKLSKEYCDHIFDLQIVLACMRPSNRVSATLFEDETSLEEVDGFKDDAVFYSNGKAQSRATATTYYGTLGCYNSQKKVKDIHNTELSEREFKSLQNQRVTICPQPTQTELFAYRNNIPVSATLGLYIGSSIAALLIVSSALAAPAIPLFMLFALAIGGLSAIHPRPFSRWQGFMQGLAAVFFAGGFLNIVMTPIIILTSVLNTVAALAMTSVLSSIVFPFALPLVILGGAAYVSLMRERTLAETFRSSLFYATLLPIIVTIHVCQAIAALSHRISGSPRQVPPTPPLVPAEEVVENSVVAPVNSNQMMMQMGINPGVRAEQVLMQNNDHIVAIEDAPSSLALAAQEEEKNNFTEDTRSRFSV